MLVLFIVKYLHYLTGPPTHLPPPVGQSCYPCSTDVGENGEGYSRIPLLYRFIQLFFHPNDKSSSLKNFQRPQPHRRYR